MKQYNLGPNGGIMTSLNLFATRFDQACAAATAGCPHRGSMPSLGRTRMRSSASPSHHAPRDTAGTGPHDMQRGGQVLELVTARAEKEELKYVFVDTPGQV